MTKFLWEHYDGEVFSDADMDAMARNTYRSMCLEGEFIRVRDANNIPIGYKYIWVAGKMMKTKVNGKW